MWVAAGCIVQTDIDLGRLRSGLRELNAQAGKTGAEGVDRRSRTFMDELMADAERVAACIDRRAQAKGYVRVSRLSYLCLDELNIRRRF